VLFRKQALPSVRDEAEPRHEVSSGLDECLQSSATRFQEVARAFTERTVYGPLPRSPRPPRGRGRAACALEHYGYKCRASVLMNILFLAVWRVSSIFAACRNLARRREVKRLLLAPARGAAIEGQLGRLTQSMLAL
jgi:hypothetical protein